MFRILNMILQILSNMGHNIVDLIYHDNYMSIEFTDKEGNKYSGWIKKVENKGEKENA